MASDSKAKILREGERLVQQGKIALAINEYLKITREDPEDVLTQNTIGDLYLRQGKIGDANQIFMRVAESYACNSYLLKAIAVYRKILNSDATNYDVSLKLASLYERQGLKVDARNLYLLIGDFCAREGKAAESLHALEKAIEIDPLNVPIQLKLAAAYLSEGGNEKAHTYLIGAARAQMKKGDVGAAMGSFRQALALRMGSPEALKGFLESALQTDGISGTLEQIKDSIEVAEPDAGVRELLGRAYLKQDDLDHAKTCFQAAFEIDESRYPSLLSLSKLYADAGKLEGALGCLDLIVSVMISRREVPALIDGYEVILDRDPNHLDTLKKLADVLSGTDEIRYRDALERMIVLYQAASRHGEALAVLEKMLELYPDSEKHLREHRELFSMVFPNLPYSPPQGSFDPRKRRMEDETAVPADSEAKDGPEMVEIDLLLNYGMKDKALQMLSTMEFKKPWSTDIRQRLLSIYKESGENRLAAEQAALLSVLYRNAEDAEKANKSWDEVVSLDAEWASSGFDLSAFALDHGIKVEAEKAESAAEPGNFEVDLSGDLSDIFFKNAAPSPEAPEPIPAVAPESGEELEAAVDEFPGDLPAPVTESVDDQLQEVDFYIRLGFMDEARSKLDHVAAAFPGHADLTSRYAQISSAPAAANENPVFESQDAHTAFDPVNIQQDLSSLSEMFEEDSPAVSAADMDAEVHELSNIPDRIPTGETFALGTEFADEIDSAIESLPAAAIPAAAATPPAVSTPLQDPKPFVPPAENNAMFSDLITEMNDLTDLEIAREDFETHFHLGIAYREMGLVDEAIKEFQTSMKILAPRKSSKEAIQCCGMLSTCFLEKGMSRSAIRWCQTGLQIQQISAHESMALRYDMAVAHDMAGDSDRALECYTAIFTMDPSYRDVAQKIDQLRSGRDQNAP